VKCIVFLGGINPNGNNDRGGGVMFCLIDGLLGFACSNDYFVGTLFFIPFLFVVDLRKLQNTNVKKETCQYLPLQMSTCSEEIKCKRDEKLYMFVAL
jgi:hypothetical protein